MNPHNPFDNGQTTTQEATKPPHSPRPSDRSERDHAGRFARGNKGGPGNPFARRTAALRQAMLDAVTEDDLQAIVRQLIQQAREGDVAAARLVLSYSIGKADKAVDPDTLDVQEFQQLQQGAVANQDFLALLGGLQAPLACTMLRALLPHLQEAASRKIQEGMQPPAAAPEPEQSGRETPADAVPHPTEQVPAQPRPAPVKPAAGRKTAPRTTATAEQAAGGADREFLQAEELAWLDFLRAVTGQPFVGQADDGDQQGQIMPGLPRPPSANRDFIARVYLTSPSVPSNRSEAARSGLSAGSG
jgi:hypothetical protein